MEKETQVTMEIQEMNPVLPSAKKDRKALCSLCGKAKGLSSLMNADLIRASLQGVITGKHPEWDRKGYVCRTDLNRIKGEYIQKILQDEQGRLSGLEEEVVRSLKENEILSENINQQFDQELTFGERVADQVAAFGGSWRFILLFAGVILVWILVNVLLLYSKPFDPYPFILLNLLLSCLAAVQAPFIMMSQNRQEDKDRLRSEYDYKVNLKAELEIRHLNEKVDHLIQYQWQHLLEIQELQLDLMQEMAKERNKKRKSL